MSIRDTIAKYRLRWRTLAGGGAVVLAGLVNELGIAPLRELLTGLLGDHVAGILAIGMGAFMIYMRLISDSPVLQPRDPDTVRGKLVDDGE